MQFLVLTRSCTYNCRTSQHNGHIRSWLHQSGSEYLNAFYSSSKINLIQTNWEGKFTFLPPNEVTTLAAFITCIKNCADPRFGTAVTFVALLEFSFGGQMYWTGPVNSAKQTLSLPTTNHSPAWQYSCHRTDRTVRPSFIFTTNERHSPSCNRHLWPVHSLYQLAEIFQ